MSLDYQNDDEIILSADANQSDPCPPGRHPAICVDVVSVGLEEAEFNGVIKQLPKVVIVWQAFPEDGSRQLNESPFLPESKFTASMAPKSRLRPFLESWRGRDFSPEESKGFNLARLKGVACWLTVEERISNGFTNANVVAADPYVDDAGNPLPPPKPEGYVRRDYTKKSQTVTVQASTTAGQVVNGADKSDWVPF